MELSDYLNIEEAVVEGTEKRRERGKERKREIISRRIYSYKERKSLVII
jgi:hypothetical protein